MSLVLEAPGWCVSKSCWVHRVNALLNNMSGIWHYLEWLGRCIFIFSIMDQVKQWLFQPSDLNNPQVLTLLWAVANFQCWFSEERQVHLEIAESILKMVDCWEHLDLASYYLQSFTNDRKCSSFSQNQCISYELLPWQLFCSSFVTLALPLIPDTSKQKIGPCRWPRLSSSMWTE